jgi:hypothetical protein
VSFTLGCRTLHGPTSDIPIRVPVDPARALAPTCDEPWPDLASSPHLSALPQARENRYELAFAWGDDRLSAGGIMQIAWLPDGKRLLTASFHDLVVWDASDGRDLAWFTSPDLLPASLEVSASGRYARIAAGAGPGLLVDLDQKTELDESDASLTDLGLTREQGAIRYMDLIDPARISPDRTRVARMRRGGGIEIVAADGSSVLSPSPLRFISAAASSRSIGGLYEVRLIEGDRCHVLAPDSDPVWARFLPGDRVQVALWTVTLEGSRRVIRGDMPVRIGTWSTRSYRLESMLEFHTYDDVLPIDGDEVLYRKFWFLSETLARGPYRRYADDCFENRLFAVDSYGRQEPPRDPPANAFNLRLLEDPARLPLERVIDEPWLVQALGHHPYRRSSLSGDHRWLAVAGSLRPPCSRPPRSPQSGEPCMNLVELWNVPTRQVHVIELQGPGPLHEAALSQDGRFLAAAMDTRLYVWDRREGHMVEELDFSPRHDRATHIQFGGDNANETITVTTARGARFVFRSR